MTTSKIRLLSCAAIIALAGTTTCLASTPFVGQAPPQSLDHSIVIAQGPLTAEQTKALAAYVGAWVDQLANANDPKSIDQSRRALIDPLRDLAALPVFRRAYSTVARPLLEPIIAGSDGQKAIVAMEVVRFLGTTEAVDTLRSQIGSVTQSDAGKRLAAAGFLAAALSDADIKQAQFDAATRAIVTAAETETQPLVVIQELNALAAITKRTGNTKVVAAPAASVTAALDAEIDVLKGIVEQLKKNNQADPRMEAVHRAIPLMRDQWIAMAGPARAKFGAALAPILVDVLSTARKHWDSSRQNPSLKKAYDLAIISAEPVLRLIDASMRPKGTQVPERALGSAWEKNSQSDFDAALQGWQKIVIEAPYR